MPRAASVSVIAPKQDRSRASFERVLDAAGDLLRERGYNDFTLQAVSKRSKTSIGSIYCRVKGKDALFRAVQEHELAKLEAELDDILDPAKWEGISAERMLAFLVRELAEYLRRNAPMLRAFIARESADPVVRNRGKKAHAKVADQFQALLMRHAAEFHHPDPEHAAEFCFNITYAAIAKHLDLDTITPSGFGAQWNQLLDDLICVVSLYLLHGPGEVGSMTTTRRRTA
jgi:AcrR family transcriptional regulator